MGLVSAITDFCEAVKAQMDAPQNLRTALEDQDLYAARAILDTWRPAREVFQDELLHVIGEYSQNEHCNTQFLHALYQSVYDHYDDTDLQDNAYMDSFHKDYSHINHKDPLRVYAIAAYMNDVDKLQKLHAQGVEPDVASNHKGVTENIVMGTLRLGMYDALREVVLQGASLDKNFGFDEFAPQELFSDPSVYTKHPEFIEFMKETGNGRVIDAINRAMSKMKEEGINPYSSSLNQPRLH